MKKILKKIHLYKQAKWFFYRLVLLKNILRNFLFPTAIILTYHRVANIINDPHQLSVSPENFFNQIDFLKKNYNVISLKQLVLDIKNKTIRRKSVAITFDDGYADNFYNALPILKKFNTPSTIFVSSGFLDGKNFYWDADPTESDRPMTVEELKKICLEPLIDIGGHTISHPHLPTLTVDQKEEELKLDKYNLEKICNKKIDFFSFPFGEYDTNSAQIAEKNGYLGSCTLGEQRATKNSKSYYLPRFLVRDWDLETFKVKIKNNFI